MSFSNRMRGPKGGRQIRPIGIGQILKCLSFNDLEKSLMVSNSICCTEKCISKTHMLPMQDSFCQKSLTSQSDTQTTMLVTCESLWILLLGVQESMADTSCYFCPSPILFWSKRSFLAKTQTAVKDSRCRYTQCFCQGGAPTKFMHMNHHNTQQ